MGDVSRSADSYYHRQWEDHWWLAPETWASGGTWQNGAFDDYHCQYQWIETWQGQETQMSESASSPCGV